MLDEAGASVLGRWLAAQSPVERALIEVGASAEATRSDPRGRPVLVGDPARPRLRLAYDGDGRLVKRLDERGTLHIAGEHYERLLTPEGVARVTKYLPDPYGGRWLLVPAEAKERARAPRPVPDGKVESEGQRPLRRMPDELWQQAGALLPESKDGAPGHGRERDLLDGILHVLRGDGDWKALPPTLGPPEALHDQFLRWRSAGFFQRLWQAGLGEHDALRTLDWARLLLK